jgi:tetratricopeptide (TPR) repeat protein
LARLEAPEQTRLMPRCFTPDGARLIAVGSDTRALHVWDLRRIRAELVKIGLGWDAEPYPDPGPVDHTPLEVTVVGAEALAGPDAKVGVRPELGNGQAEQARWDKLTAEYAALVQKQPEEHLLWYRYAILCLQRGDVAGYRRCCAALLERFQGTADASIAHRVALACLLVPEAVGDPKLPAQLAERGVAGAPRDPWHLFTLAAAHYRAGRHADAMKRLQEAIKVAQDRPDAFRHATILSRLFLAMTYHSAGRARSAKELLDQTTQAMDRDLPRAGLEQLGDSWHDWIMCQVIRREAEAVLRDQAPAVSLASGREQAVACHWKEAAAQYAKVVASHQLANDVFVEQACLTLLADDADGYLKSCATMRERFGKLDDPMTDYVVARTGLLAPKSGLDPLRAVKLAEQALNAKLPFDGERAARLHVLGMAHYRAEQFDQAVRRLDESIAAKPDWIGTWVNWPVLALAHHRLGHAEDARRWLDKSRGQLAHLSRQIADKGVDVFQEVHPTDWLEFWVLYREAKGVMADQPKKPEK